MALYPRTKDELYQEFCERLTGHHHKHRVGIPNTSHDDYNTCLVSDSLTCEKCRLETNDHKSINFYYWCGRSLVCKSRDPVVPPFSDWCTKAGTDAAHLKQTIVEAV